MHIYNYHSFSSAGNSARPLKKLYATFHKNWYHTKLVGKVGQGNTLGCWLTCTDLACHTPQVLKAIYFLIWPFHSVNKLIDLPLMLNNSRQKSIINFGILFINEVLTSICLSTSNNTTFVIYDATGLNRSCD